MPTASSIQVVNDANGTAYAFLEDNGYLWQCQWNAEAQRWDKGQVVPGAYGGEKLQALYLENLWPTSDSSGNNLGTAPGVVLAYRVGEGSSSQVLATFGRWGSDGQLQWSAPETLSASGVEVQAFTLVPGEASTQTDSAGLKGQGQSTFSLVVQLQQPQPPAISTLEQLAQTPEDQLQAALEQLATASRPDADLYRSNYRIAPGANTTAAPLVQSYAGKDASGQPSWNTTATLTPAAQESSPAGSPLLLGGNTQLSRQQLVVAPAPVLPGHLARGDDRAAGGEIFTAGQGPPASSGSGGDGFFYEPKKKGKPYFLTNENTRRWSWGGLSRQRIKDAGANAGGENTLKGDWVLQGSFGKSTFSNSSSFTYSIARVQRSKRELTAKDYKSAGRDKDLLDFTRILEQKELGIAGFAGTQYLYDDSTKSLLSVNTKEGISLDWNVRRVYKNAKNGTLRISWYNGSGFTFEQSLSNPQGISGANWLSIVGKIPGIVKPIEGILGLVANGIKALVNFDKIKENYDNVGDLPGFKVPGKDSLKTLSGVFNIIDTGVGVGTAVLGPALVGFDKALRDSNTFSKTRGLSNFTRATAGWLIRGVAGLQGTFVNNFNLSILGDAGSTVEDRFLVNLGVALPLGVYLPLVSYTESWGSVVAPGANPSALEGALSVESAAAATTQKSAFISAPNGAAYPFSYAPQSADNSYFAPDPSGGSTNPYLLGASTETFQLLTLQPYSGAVNDGSSGSAPLTLVNPGRGLVDGSYSDVPILGLALTGGSAAFARASFTVAGGSIAAASLQITAGGSSIGLPETQPGSGIYALVLDVFSTGIATPPPPGFSGNPLASLPLLTVDSSRDDSPLSATPIQRVSSVPVPADSQPSGVVYPEYDPSAPITEKTSTPASNNNGPYTYQDVGVTLLDAGVTLALLNPGPVTATVVLSGGTIQRVDLDQPLLFSSASSGTPSTSAFAVQLALPAPVVRSLPRGTAPPSFAVSPQSQAYSNVVAEEEFSAQSGALNSGVYLAAGASDQLPLLRQMAGWPVQNRVTYSTFSDDGTTATWVLNRLQQSQPGSRENAAPIAPPTLDQVYRDQATLFSAASHPTAVTIAGPQGAPYSGATFVAWVEASEPVIPPTSADGSSNYQVFLQALYGNQRLNFRILQADGTWATPNLADLYSPSGAVISQLQSFQVTGLSPSSWFPDGEATLLVWDELAIDAIQDVQPAVGAGASIPSVLKAGWINPAATSFQWNDLFSFTDGSGQTVSSIQTIPWDSSTAVGLTISDISAGSLPVVAPDGSASSTAVINFSQTVRTPYRQSVLNDQPSLYLELGALESGLNAINIGTNQDPATTSTFASETGLNFTIPGALPKSQAAAVQNLDGTGVLSTGLGTLNAPNLLIARNIPTQLAVFSGSISGTTLSITSLAAGRPQLGDGLSGAGVTPGTTITAVLDADAVTGLGTYTVSQSQSVAAATLQALPQPAGLLSFSGAIDGTTLTVTALPQGSLNVGDVVAGQGVVPGTRITAVLSPFDPATGQGSYSVDRSQSLASSALVAASPLPSDPYTLEFWAQLQPGSNPEGAGLVALGQPSAGAIGPASLPEGWLLGASFVVDLITYQQAAGQGLIAAIPSGKQANDTYGWGWAVVATGADTTAMDGNGGNNLYSNALQINNLVSGVTLAGVNSFLANYGVSASQLIGIDGSTAATMANVPFTELQFNTFLDSGNNNLPTSNLNGIAVDTNTAVMNGGLLQAIDVENNANLNTLFTTLWNYQQQTGEAKVSFNLAPGKDTTPPTPTSNEQYSGYALEFTLLNGPAVSVNDLGQLVFDVAPGVSLTSSQGVDLRDGQWHYIAASYLPEYGGETVPGPNGTPIQPPTLNGTATLVVDNQVVGSSPVRAAYTASNLSDQALLLAGNAAGAIDQFALYEKALTTSTPPVGVAGVWPQPTAEEALALWGAAGVVVPGQTPDQGEIPGALTAHWAARDVNPNGAELATYSTVFDPASQSWSPVSTLNPQLAPQPSTPSAVAPGSLQNDLVIAVPSSSWTSSGWNETGVGSGVFFNPANQQLKTVTVTLTDTKTNAKSTFTLNSDQVLLGGQTLQSLQPQAKGTSLDYTVLSEAPAFSLLIPRDQINVRDAYTATYSFTFADGTSAADTSVSNATPVPVNVFASSVASSGLSSSTVQTTLTNRSQALATAQLLEQAPLQLQYIDSGEVFRSRPTAATTSSKALSNTPESFGQSQVFGSFTDSSGNTNGWLAIAQPSSLNAGSDPAGRIWIQYTGQSSGSGKTSVPSTDPAQAPTTWLNALANSNFSPDAPNLPLLGDALYPSSSGGLLIQADPTAGWGQQLGQTMLVVDVNKNGTQDLVIAAPAANGGGLVYIVDGSWIQNNLTQNTGSTILNLANPSALGPYVTILRAQSENLGSDGYDTSQAGFGSALAFDASSNTLWIGAPNVLQQLNAGSSDPLSSLVPAGAVYSYNLADAPFNGQAISLAPAFYGSSGTATVPGAAGGTTKDTTKEYWGSQLGTAIAVDGSGNLAVSAPGVVASLAYSGTEPVQQQAIDGKTITSPYGDGALVKIQLPGVSGDVTASNGTNAALVDVVSQNTTSAGSQLAREESVYMQTLKSLQSVQIADATLFNNLAYQAAAVGAVYVWNPSSQGGAVPLTAQGVYDQGGYTLYGPNPWNVLGPSGFGSSLTFADLINSNSDPVLAIGADQAGGSGAVYLVDTSQAFTNAAGWVADINLGGNQYLGYLASGFTLYGAATADNFGNGLVNLGDVNNDGYDDLLIQAFNASEGAGNGYVLFGADQFSSTSPISTKSGPLTINNPASGNVATATIGQMTRADGTTFTASILNELGYGPSAFTGLGSFGPGDVNGDGLPDILLGAGGDASAYLTYGQEYLESITDLQLQKLTSSTGYRLEGLATTTQGSLRSIGDFNDDGYGDFISIQPGDLYTTVRLELGGNTEEILADYLYEYYSFTVANGTEVLGAGDINGDGYSDIALFLQQNLSSAADGNGGAGSTTGILFGRSSDQLPIGSGFGLQAPVDAASNPLAPLPSTAITGALSTMAPAMLAAGDTVYAVWVGEGSGSTDLWFAQSLDGGETWQPAGGASNDGYAATKLSAYVPALASSITPSLALFNGRLYLAFLNDNGQISLSSWDPSSADPTLWSNPTVLSNGSAQLKSIDSPALIANGDVLSVIWVDGSDGTLQASSSTTPDLSSISGGLGPASAWSPVGDGTSPNTPAIVSDGLTVYMAMRGENNQLYWTSSSDGGQSWYGWQELPSSMTTNSAPSLAIVEGELYLTFTGEDEQLFATQLQAIGGNQWSVPPTKVSNQTAATDLGAVCIAETVDGVEGLALYYGDSNGSGDLLRTWSSTPLNSASWSDSQRLGITTSSSNGFTTSSPLAVTRFQGNTVLAYLGDASSTNTTAYITTAGDSPDNSSSWTTISTRNTGNTLGISLASDADGLLLNTSNSDTNDQSIYRLKPSTDGGSWSQSFYTNRASISSSAPTAALLALPSTGSPAQLLLAVADTANSGSIDVSAFYPQAENSSWSPATPLQQLIDTDGTVKPQSIFATAAPSATLLDGTPVLAVNNNGVISVYASNGGNTLSLASSFSSETNNPAGITSTDTGLALSYLYNEGSVRLQRLNLLNPDGTPVEGVLINPDGSLDTSSVSLAWQGIDLDAANGLSTGLATVPLNVNGGLLLGSTSNANGSTNQVQLSAIPVVNNPDSTTWLNSTVQLPDGSGGWTIQQQSGGSTGLDANQTGSSLSPVGDLNNDGYADLLVSANNVLLNPGSNPASATQATGLRVITGAATGSQILTANDASADSQTVQVAPGFGSGSSTPVASLGASVNGVPTLVLSATNQSSGQGSALQSLPYNTAPSWDASAGDLASAQQLFSPMEAPVSGSLGLGLGFGDLALNTTGTYGDLNADGYLDTLVGDATYAFGVNGMGWHVWSIRAAGDVNGNGADDVLLSLSPTEVPLTAAGQPQDLQTVLVDGSLFEVDKASNSFSLRSLRVPLDPGAGAGLQGYGGGEGTPTTLQFWIQPVQAFQAPAIDTNSEASPFTLTNTATDQYGFNSGIATATSDDGVGYVIAQGVPGFFAAGKCPLQIQSVNALTSEVSNLGEIATSTLFGSDSSSPGFFTLANNGAVFYRGRLYLASYSVVEPDYTSGPLSISSIAIENLTAEGIANSANWSSYTLPSTYASTFAPALVNEGDRLGLYFVSASNNYLSAGYAYEPEGGAAAWGAVNTGTFTPGSLQTIQTDKQSVKMTVNSEETDYELPNIAATRFQGRTIVTAFSPANSDNTGNGYLLLEQPLAGSSSQWNQYELAIPDGLQRSWWLQANATQLFLGAISNGISFYAWGENLDSSVASFDVYSSNLGASLLVPGSGLNVFSFYSTGDGGYDAPGATTSTLFPATWSATSGTPITPSLAGYSIDGNIDVNGDGFMDMLVSDPSNPAAGLANQYVLFGGDYNQLASQVGTPGNDVMLGTPLADVIYSIQGADQVSSNGGKDVIYTAAGDDAISIQDNAFVRIDAGSGFDVLLLEGLANQAYDFRLNLSSPEYFVGSKLRDIELISSIDYGANLLSFDAAAINAINPDRVLFLTPDASDSIALSAEFSRNASFDTSFAGTLWSAYAGASSSATPASGNPALIYVRTPDGQSASWLDSQVSTQLPSALNAIGPFASGRTAGDAGLFSSNARGAGTGAGAAAAAVAADQPFSPLTSPIAASTDFGDGLTLVAYRTAPASGLARFSLQRADSRRRQVIAYGSSSANSRAKPGSDYTAVAGLVVLEAGQVSEEITVPIDSVAFALLRGGSLSLLVEELADQGQQPLHLLIAPASAADLAPASVTTADAVAAGSAAPPVLSGFELVPSADGTGASLRFRADSNGGTQALDQLQLSVSRRASATSTAVEAAQRVSLLDAMVSSGDPPPAFDAVPGALALDNDQRHNGQISAQLALNFTAQVGQPVVSLVAPDLQWQSSLQLQPDFSLSFSDAAPFTLWRADNGGSGPVSFGLQSGSQTITLLRDAEAGSAGSITPDSALSGDAITGWRATEGLSVGSRSAVDGLDLTGTTWTPTASRDGQPLALLGLSQEGNQITASFEGGVMAVYGMQSTGSAPTPTPIRPAVEVQRLAGYDNSLGFYALDDPITGAIDGLRPGEEGYLERALARSEGSGLLLSASDLPTFGEAQRYTDLALDPNRSHGVLLLVDGDRSQILSSFAAANPGGAVQVISLGTSRTGLVLGFEDQAVTGGNSDGDYNDLVVNITNISVPLF